MENNEKNTIRKSTLRDVAKAANVSVATVSRVLNDAPHVSDKIKNKVQAAIDELKFAPNPTAQALNTGRTFTVGALIPTLDHAIFSKFLNSVERRLYERKHSLVISTTGDDPEIELTKATKLLKMGAEALIVSGENRHPDFDPLMKRHQIPVILTSYYSRQSKHPSIGYDNAAISKIALDHLYAKTHRSIAVVHGPTDNNDRTRARLEGVRADQRFGAISYLETDISVSGGTKAAKQILANAPHPTAILCLSDVIALGVMFELKRQNISVPKQIAVMGFDNLSWAEHTNPPLTSIELSVETMGEKVSDQICDFLDNGKPIKSTLLTGRLIKRDTT